MAAVRIDEEAFSDARVKLLGELVGYNAFEALGRLAHLWRYCTQHETHTVPAAIVESILGTGGAEAIVRALLGELVDSGIRVRGTAGRIEWLGKRRAASKAGGEATKANWLATTEPHGLATEPSGSVEAQSCPDESVQSVGPNGGPLTLTLTLPNKDLRNPIAPKKPRGRPRKLKPSEPTEPELASVREILEKLTTRNGVRYTGTETHTRLIVGRLRDGFTEMDLRKVVAYCAEELGWQTDPKMASFLRPETLFGPTTISRYADAARAWYELAHPEKPLVTEPLARRFTFDDGTSVEVPE